MLTTLWLTEANLPNDTKVIFMLMSLLGFSWIAVVVRIVFKSHALTQHDLIASSLVAVMACISMLVATVVVWSSRSQFNYGIWILSVEFGLLILACMLLYRSLKRRTQLLKALKKIQTRRSLTNALLVIGLLICSVGQINAKLNVLNVHETLVKTRNNTSILAESGHVLVPLRHAEPEGKQIKIAFIRIKGTDPVAAPTLILAGGPGDSGINIVKRMVGDGGKKIRQIISGDLIGIDQRGIGQSIPSLNYPKSFNFSISKAGDESRYNQKIIAALSAAKVFYLQQGIDLCAFNTAENASDIAFLANVLGYDQVNLWGTSFGSHLALALINQYPKIINRVFIASPEGPDHTIKSPTIVDKALNRIKPNQQLLIDDQLVSILKSLDKQEQIVTINHPIDQQPIEIHINGFDLRLWMWHSLSHTKSIKQMITETSALTAGDFTTPARWLLNYRATSGLNNITKYVMDASSGCSKARCLLAQNQKDGSVFGSTINFPLAGIIKANLFETLPDSFRNNPQTNIPVLILVGNHDVRTPIEHAEELLVGMPNATLLIIDNWAHGFKPTANINEIIAKFYAGEALPDRLRVTMP